MIEHVKLTVLDSKIVERRTEKGLIIPGNAASGPVVIDCGDKRPLTPESQQLRQQRYNTNADVIPYRFFGSAPGLALAALGTICAQSKSGPKTVENYLRKFNGEAITDLAGTIATRLQMTRGIETNLHSASANEGNTSRLADPNQNTNPLGCGLAHNFGKVLALSSGENALAEAQIVAGESGIDSAVIRQAHAGIQALSAFFPVESSIHRGAVHHARTRGGHLLEVPILDTERQTQGKTQLVYDMSGFRSDATAHYDIGLPRYHTTPGLAADLLPTALPTFEFDSPDIMTGVALVLAAGTRAVLEIGGGNELPGEIITPDFLAA
jgi:hypothetical protein